ncbi:lysoplasmalogenase [Vibrio sinensis]|uniref:Lysoplasmalogenase n=1 Tax=Vibrio sinensis TaxID=2302434 RepID=A0A3A6R2V8_9VIBR|nr:lysoplasmalogenase [Vibrio sinensis]RJX75467.1 lysoplasmalogenase [Vibrio sinensis]
MWLAIITFSLIHIASIDRGPRWLFYFSKPIPIFFLSLIAYSHVSPNDTFPVWIALGLLLSMCGDLFLMHPKDKFIAGLSCFFCAHLSYAYAFLSISNVDGLNWIFYLLAAIGVIIYLLLLPSLGEMKSAVGIYIFAILLMAWGAIDYWATYPIQSAALGAFGAIIFIISDIVLALDRFRSSSGFSRHVVMVTYYTAQCLITLSVVVRYQNW